MARRCGSLLRTRKGKIWFERLDAALAGSRNAFEKVLAVFNVVATTGHFRNGVLDDLTVVLQLAELAEELSETVFAIDLIEQLLRAGELLFKFLVRLLMQDLRTRHSFSNGTVDDLLQCLLLLLRCDVLAEQTLNVCFADDHSTQHLVQLLLGHRLLWLWLY